MNEDEIQEYLEWKSSFSWKDDGPHAFRAIKKLAAIDFELTMGQEGYLERVKAITES